MSDIYVQVNRGTASNELQLRQLAELRASPSGAFNYSLFCRLLGGMLKQSEAGLLKTVKRPGTKWSGWWVDESQPDEVTCSQPLRGGVKHMIPCEVECVTREAATALRAIDQNNWPDGALKWLGVVQARAHRAILSIAASPEKKPLTTPQMKIKLIGTGEVRNSKNSKVEWGYLVENAKLICAARVSAEGVGRASLWDEEEFRHWLDVNGYKLHPKHVDDARKPNSAHDPFGATLKTG